MVKLFIILDIGSGIDEITAATGGRNFRLHRESACFLLFLLGTDLSGATFTAASILLPFHALRVLDSEESGRHILIRMFTGGLSSRTRGRIVF